MRVPSGRATRNKLTVASSARRALARTVQLRPFAVVAMNGCVTR